MDCAGLPENPKYEKHSTQKMINAMVGALIARRGYFAVIDELIADVYHLGEISLADPANSTKLRDFDTWAQAVRAAILKHDDENAFESRVTECDRYLARQMGIILDYADDKSARA